jgi:hypothetical protein
VEVEWIACIHEGSCILRPCSTKDGDFLGIIVRRLAAPTAVVDSDPFLDRLVVDVLLCDVKVK